MALMVVNWLATLIETGCRIDVLDGAEVPGYSDTSAPFDGDPDTLYSDPTANQDIYQVEFTPALTVNSSLDLAAVAGASISSGTRVKSMTTQRSIRCQMIKIMLIGTLYSLL